MTASPRYKYRNVMRPRSIFAVRAGRSPLNQTGLEMTGNEKNHGRDPRLSTNGVLAMVLQASLSRWATRLHVALLFPLLLLLLLFSINLSDALSCFIIGLTAVSRHVSSMPCGLNDEG